MTRERETVTARGTEATMTDMRAVKVTSSVAVTTVYSSVFISTRRTTAVRRTPLKEKVTNLNPPQNLIDICRKESER